jgi:hypothetical protein
VRLEVQITATGLYATSVAHINGDGRLDVAVAAATTIAVLEGLGDGRFADPVYIPVTSAQNLTSGDFNKDGRPDFAVWAGGTTTTVRIVLNETEFLPAIPVLSWIRAGATTRLVWYTNYPGFGLEYRPALDTGTPWAPVTGSSLVIDCESFYTISTNPPGFYRLHQSP